MDIPATIGDTWSEPIVSAHRSPEWMKPAESRPAVSTTFIFPLVNYSPVAQHFVVQLQINDQMITVYRSKLEFGWN